ncbi:MAG TPA: hypothetical protein VFX33_17220 [Actinomycetales bacterium]|nr:hypothetical protein [Actinomycetales bacterium]
MSVTTATNNGTAITHRYPWSLEERVVIAALVIAPPAITAWLTVRDGFKPVLAAVLLVVGWSAAFGLYRLGAGRKNKSRVTATLSATHLEVHGGRVKQSRGDIADTREVVTEQLGPETVLILTGPGGTLKVPMRIATHEALAPVLREHLLKDGVILDDGARVLLAIL